MGTQIINVEAKMLLSECSDKSNSTGYVELPFRLTIGLKKINNHCTIVHEHHSIPGK